MTADTLKDTRDEILARWIESVVSKYPEETARFLRGQSDRFANPVGASLREGLGEILDGVLQGVDPSDLESALDRVIRIRAVQEMSPTEAVGFVFELKTLLPDGLECHVRGSDQTVATDAQIDRLALLAFDVYMRCRETVWQIRNAEVKNLSVGIMERVAEWRARKDSEEGVAPR